MSHSLNPGPEPLYFRRESAPHGRYRCSMCAGPMSGPCVIVSSERRRIWSGMAIGKPHDFWAGFCLKCIGELGDAAEEP